MFTSDEAAWFTAELDRLRHDQLCVIPDCERGPDCPLLPCTCQKQYRCPCGCKQIVACPGGNLCRQIVSRLRGWPQTKAVRQWMAAGLCVCPLVIPGILKSQPGHEPDWRNWSARRRRKLGRCPGCGAYFANELVRGQGLYSESEWRRLGYPKFIPGPKYYLDPDVAKYVNAFQSCAATGLPLTHVRHGPQPAARIWRPCYDRRSRRFDRGIWSVDLFSLDMMDQSKRVLTLDQCLSLVGDAGKPYVACLPVPKPQPDEIVVQVIRGAWIGRQTLGTALQPDEEWGRHMRVLDQCLNLSVRVLEDFGDRLVLLGQGLLGQWPCNDYLWVRRQDLWLLGQGRAANVPVGLESPTR
jgi:hypothetical protein